MDVVVVVVVIVEIVALVIGVERMVDCMRQPADHMLEFGMYAEVDVVYEEPDG